MSEKFIVVDTFDYQPTAAAAKALLEEKGMKVLLTDVEMTNTNWLWKGFIGGIKVLVPTADAPAAQEMLAAFRKAGEDVVKAGEGTPLSANCLSCGAPLTGESQSCKVCGWSFQGEEVIRFKNGPLPASLIPFAYCTILPRAFALRADKIGEYLAWCKENGVTILGWELWTRDVVSHTVLDRVEHGSAVELERASARLHADQVDQVWFNVQAADAESAEEAGA